jgi:hypothetical protein
MAGMDSRTIRGVAFGAFAGIAVACAVDDAWVDEGDDGVMGEEELAVLGDDALPGQCKKVVHLHLANWAAADPLDDPRAAVAPNGCWTFDMAHEYGHYWAHCKGASNKGTNYPNTWIANWGSPSTWEPGGPKMWVYNETRKDRSPYPSDSERINNCVAHLKTHWGTTPAKGYEYMTYQGQSGWFKSGNAKIVRSFAELYGPGTWWPHWQQWKSKPVGRPMAQIPDSQHGGNARTVVKGMCEYVTSGNWIGLWVPNSAGKLAYDSPAFKSIVNALNACTGAPGGGGAASGGGDGADEPEPEPEPQPEPEGGACETGIKECTGDWTYRECTDGAWSDGWSCAGFPGTTCDWSDGYCKSPQCGYLFANMSLGRDQSWWSCDGRFVLSMQNDGNLVLYQSGTPLWASNTQGTDGQVAIMQDDGNFLVKDSAWNTLWGSNTWGHPGAYAAVQDDGNLVVYGAPENQQSLWASGTGGH